jgi:hypothetical protein
VEFYCFGAVRLDDGLQTGLLIVRRRSALDRISVVVVLGVRTGYNGPGRIAAGGERQVAVGCLSKLAGLRNK